MMWRKAVAHTPVQIWYTSVTKVTFLVPALQKTADIQLGNSEPALREHILSHNEVNELLASLRPTRTGFCSSFASRENN